MVVDTVVDIDAEIAVEIDRDVEIEDVKIVEVRGMLSEILM